MFQKVVKAMMKTMTVMACIFSMALVFGTVVAT